MAHCVLLAQFIRFMMRKHKNVLHALQTRNSIISQLVSASNVHKKLQ